jgi:hypothetical protein
MSYSGRIKKKKKNFLILIWPEAESASELVASGKANAKFSLYLITVILYKNLWGVKNSSTRW